MSTPNTDLPAVVNAASLFEELTKLKDKQAATEARVAALEKLLNATLDLEVPDLSRGIKLRELVAK